MFKKEKYSMDLDKNIKNYYLNNNNSLKTASVLDFEEIKKNATQMAFDVFKVKNDPYDSLWMLEEIEGKPYLVRASHPEFNSEKNGNWQAISDYDNQNITLAYKNTPIARFSSKAYGYSEDEVYAFKKALLDLINNDKDFLKEVFSEQPLEKRTALSVTFPEFKNFI